MEFHPVGREVVIRDELANRVVIMSGGMLGRLIITDCRIVHRCIWPLSSILPELVVDLAEVESVFRFNIMGFVPNGVGIQTFSGEVLKFQVFSAADISRVLANLMQQFVRSNSEEAENSQ